LAFQLLAAMAEAPGVTGADLKAKILRDLQATHVEIEDMSGTFPTPLACPSSFMAICRLLLLTTCTGGCGQAFSAVIVSHLFEKKTTLARHRLVNNALKTEIAAIHAWTPKCYTPVQWEQQIQDGKHTGDVVDGTTA
jgi:stress-induced morphogen